MDRKNKTKQKTYAVSPCVSNPYDTKEVQMAIRNLVFYVICFYCIRSMHLFCTLQKLNPTYVLEVSQGSVCCVPHCPAMDTEMPFLRGWTALTPVVSKMPESLVAAPQSMRNGLCWSHNQPERKTKHAPATSASLLNPVEFSADQRLATLGCSHPAQHPLSPPPRPSPPQQDPHPKDDNVRCSPQAWWERDRPDKISHSHLVCFLPSSCFSCPW